MTFYEALKANETKRVKAFFDGKYMGCWDVGMLIDALDKGEIHEVEWKWSYQVIEGSTEFWCILINGAPIAVHNSKKQADMGAKVWVIDQSPVIALFREVPGTREEVKP